MSVWAPTTDTEMSMADPKGVYYVVVITNFDRATWDVSHVATVGTFRTFKQADKYTQKVERMFPKLAAKIQPLATHKGFVAAAKNL